MDQQTRIRLGRLADPAKVHGQLRRDAIAARNAAIDDAYREGHTLADIAAAMGLSVSYVHRIVLKAAAQRQGGH